MPTACRLLKAATIQRSYRDHVPLAWAWVLFQYGDAYRKATSSSPSASR